MNLTRPLPRIYPGMGVVSFHDTGDGITPANFKAFCCTGTFGTFTPVDSCNAFVQSNQSKFGAESPCSDAGIANLNYEDPVGGVIPVTAPKIDLNPESPTYGQAINPCTNQLVQTTQDAIDLQTCLAKIQAAKQAEAVKAAMTQNAAGQCAAIKADCANRTFAVFLSPSSDCTDCTFDWLKPGSLFLVAGGLLVGGLILVKLLK